MEKLAEKYIQDHRRQTTKLELSGKKLFLESDELSQQQVANRMCSLDDVIHCVKVERKCARSVAIITSDTEIKVVKSIGSILAQFGYENKKGKFLYPEETLYLMETNRLELMTDLGSLSLKEAYEKFLDRDNLPLKKYRVYKCLSSEGYRLVTKNQLEKIQQTYNNLESSLTIAENDVEEVHTSLQSDQLDLRTKRKSTGRNDLVVKKAKCNSQTSQINMESSNSTKLDEVHGTDDTEDHNILNDDKAKIASDIQNVFNRIKMYAPKNVSEGVNNSDLDYYFMYLPNSNHKNKPNYKLYICEDGEPWIHNTSEDLPSIYAVCSCDNIAFYTLCGVELPSLPIS